MALDDLLEASVRQRLAQMVPPGHSATNVIEAALGLLWHLNRATEQVGPVTLELLPDGDCKATVGGRFGAGPGWEEAIVGALTTTNGGGCG